VAGAFAAAEVFRFDVTARRDEADTTPAVGDPVVLELTFRYPSGASRPELVREFPPDVTVLGEDRLDQRQSDGHIQERRRLRLAFFELGNRRLSALRYTSRIGKQTLEARTDPITVTIRALRTETDEVWDKPEPPWIIPFPAWRLAVVIGAILMKRTGKNLEGMKAKGEMVSILAGSALKSYEIRAKVKDLVTSGPIFDGMNAELSKMGMKASGVWVFEVKEVWNQSANYSAGTKMV